MLLFFCVIGCSSGPSTVSGKVNYRGVPVTGGTISMHFDGKPPQVGSIDGNGGYSIQTATTGRATFTVETESMNQAGALGMPAKDKPGETKLGGGATAYVKIPARYADPKSSLLSYEVKSGSQTKNWELTD